MRKVGFTLIELLVVISIIGILAALSLVSYTGVQKQTRDTQRKSDLGQYRTALEAYGAANNSSYPLTGSLCTGLEPNFISECLTDPKGGSYVYEYRSGGQQYILWATLETGDYWEACSDGRSGKVTAQPTDENCDL